jgi:hypothetical protein
MYLATVIRSFVFSPNPAQIRSDTSKLQTAAWTLSGQTVTFRTRARPPRVTRV